MFTNLKCHVRLLSMLNIGGEEFETRKSRCSKKEKANQKRRARCLTGKIEQFIIPCNKAGWLLARNSYQSVRITMMEDNHFLL